MSLELGGKSPNIVFADADFEAAVDGALFGMFINQGEVCSAGSRILVQRRSTRRVRSSAIVERAKRSRSGPRSTRRRDGPLVSREQFDRVRSYQERIGKARREARAGRRARGGRGASAGYFVEPTIFPDVTTVHDRAGGDLRAGRLRDPVRRRARRGPDRERHDYGLAAAVWSQDPDRCLDVAKRLRAGTVWINDFHLINCIAPFGGYKQSGIGREMAAYGLNEYTEVKHVHWDLGTPKEQKMFGVLISE